jgi:type IV secretion system protein VirB4
LSILILEYNSVKVRTDAIYDMLKFSTSKADREKVAKYEYGASGFIPYRYHFNETTVVTDSDELIQVVKINGFSFETADDDDLDIKKDLRNLLFKSMTSPTLGLYFHIIRRRQHVYPDDYESTDMPDGFAKYLDQKWFQKNKNRQAFANDLYITLINSSQGASAGAFADKISSIFNPEAIKEGKAGRFGEVYDELTEATERVLNALRDYTPKVLGIRYIDGVAYSEIAEFFGKIVNCGVRSRMMCPLNDIHKYIVTNRLYFGSKGALEAKTIDGIERYAGMVSVKEYGPRTWAGIMDTFLKLPFEFVISQSFIFSNRQAAINRMQLQQNRMIQAGDKAISQIAEITEALDKAMSGEIAFGSHHLTVMCVSDTIKELKNLLSIVSVELTNTGGVGVQEKINMEPAFWAQLPGNFDFIVRSSVINSMNLAAFNSFHNYPVGKPRGNHWGDAVTVLDTTSSTPYFFNFHLRDVGHTTIIGPTGAGKTVMMNFLCAQSQKFKPRLFFFDKDRGAEIFLRALGAVYTIIDPSKSCGFNPLMLPDTGENRTFLLDWMKQLVSTNGEEINSTDVGLLTEAINGNYKLDKRDRRLSNIAPFLGLGGPGTLAGRLAMWHGNGSHARVFDNEVDAIDFAQSNVFGFEMAELLKDKSTLGPALSYIFHRINLSLDGTPSMIVLDEAWALIDNPIFAPKIKDWLKVLRKLNTFVVFATQSVEDASKSSISDTLIQQTATQIFLPNLKATDVYRKVFMLSAREFELIKTTDPGTRYFLVKQGNDSVVARIDLSGMDDVIHILSGRADTVLILDEVRKIYGNDPNIWIPQFIARVQEKNRE